MKQRSGGFTLIEVMVAVALFALAAALALGGMSAITRSRAQLDAELDRQAKIVFAIGLMERDLRGAAVRPIREAYGAQRPALEGRLDQIELSHYGAIGLPAAGRSAIERVGYQLDGDRLLRLRYPVLDRTASTAPTIDTLLDRVVRIQWRYAGSAGAPLAAQWPPPSQGIALPRAVELRLVLEDAGEIRRLFELPLLPAPTLGTPGVAP